MIYIDSKNFAVLGLEPQEGQQGQQPGRGAQLGAIIPASGLPALDRLVANVIIAYNSVLLSTLLERYRREDDRKGLALLRKISPVAWQHIHLLGHYTFRGGKHAINPEALLANVRLG